MDNIKIKPLFKYIGGKSWLRAELRYLVEKIFENNKYNSYCEPFVGGLGSFLNIYDILLKNNIKNKNNYNREDTHKKKNIPYRSDRYGDDFNWDSLYANYKEISATSNV